MDEIIFTSEITVELMDRMGSDNSIATAARASTLGKDSPGSQRPIDRLIDSLIRKRHGTPSEHSALSLFVHAPAFVWWEWIRHRVGQTISVPGLSDDVPDASFNLESGRYKVLEPCFWVPRPDRKMVPSAKHTPMTPDFIEADADAYRETVADMKAAYQFAWGVYQRRINRGVANEVARAVLGFGVYYSGWVTCNPRSLMSFLSLRTHDPLATFISFPQAEIEEAARAAEAILEEFWPLTHASFVRRGRVGP